MSIALAAVDAALISAQPVLAVTAYPLLAATAGVALWLRDQYGQDDDDDADADADNYSVADYFPVAVGRARVPGLRPVEAHTQVVDPTAWNADTPLFAALAAEGVPDVVLRRVARNWLIELGQRARAGATA